MRLKKFLLAAFMVLAAPCICAAKDSASVFRVSVMQSDEHLFHESIIENLEGTLEKALGTKTKVEISTDSSETIKAKFTNLNPFHKKDSFCVASSYVLPDVFFYRGLYRVKVKEKL